jgi:hypothetical protein
LEKKSSNLTQLFEEGKLAGSKAPSGKITTSTNTYDLTNSSSFYYYTSDNFSITWIKDALHGESVDVFKRSVLESGIWIDDNGKYYLYVSSAFPSEAIRAYLQIQFSLQEALSEYDGE